MDTKIENLLDIGLTRGESKVYMALLESGSSTVGPIVKKSGIAYSNVYEVLERLINKGLASFIIKNNTKYFQPSSPESLLDYVEKREKEIERQKEIIKDLIPKFRIMQKIKPEQEAEIFLGVKGLRTAYTRLLSEHKGEWLFFYIHQEEYAKESDIFFRNISKIFKTPRIAVKGICNMEYKKSKFAKTARFMKIKYVDFPIPGIIDICNDKILMVSWNKKPVAFLIKSQQITDSMREYFNSAWKMAK